MWVWLDIYVSVVIRFTPKGESDILPIEWIVVYDWAEQHKELPIVLVVNSPITVDY